MRKVLLLVVFAALGLVPQASAAWTWGFNYLTPTSPTNACALGYTGMACSGYNNNDFMTMDKQNGDVVRMGFRDDPSVWWVQLDSSYNGWSPQVDRWTLGAPQYNRVYCKYQSGNSTYCRCWS